MGSGPKGFAQRVTGCGESPEHTVHVRNFSQLKDAVERAAEQPGTLVVVATKVDGDGDAVMVRARDLTIYGAPGMRLAGVRFDVDTTTADNVVFQNLTLGPVGSGDHSSDYQPSDGFHFLTPGGRRGKGFWIDHCSFEAFPDQCIQTLTESSGPERLLLSVSHCHFAGNPHWHNQGSVEISGYAAKGPDGAGAPPDYDVCVSVYRNVFHQSRRRAPRSSEWTFVHAYNNVLVDWGAADGKQSNGMESGNNGLLAVVGNHFTAGALKHAVEVAAGDYPGLVQFKVDGEDTNVYRNGAEGPAQNTDLGIGKRYERNDLRPPSPAPMSDELAAEIRAEAGAILPG